MSKKNKVISKGELFADGKTKRLYDTNYDQTACIVESKTTITANDNPALTKEFATKGIAANITTCNVFEVLKLAGIPIAFREKLSETTFLADKCIMIPLEVIGRRYAYGSFLKREPTYKKKDRFEEVLIEYFLKTTGGQCVYGDSILDSDIHVEDPYIGNIGSKMWQLLDPKMPYANSDSFIKLFDSTKILDGNFDIAEVGDLAIKVYMVLEDVWAKLGLRLIDFKIEFGLNQYGKLVVSDVIDNDSWRLLTEAWEDLSKQSFRDGEDLSEVEKKYLKVMELSNEFELVA